MESLSLCPSLPTGNISYQASSSSPFPARTGHLHYSVCTRRLQSVEFFLPPVPPSLSLQQYFIFAPPFRSSRNPPHSQSLPRSQNQHTARTRKDGRAIPSTRRPLFANPNPSSSRSRARKTLTLINYPPSPRPGPARALQPIDRHLFYQFAADRGLCGQILFAQATRKWDKVE